MTDSSAPRKGLPAIAWIGIGCAGLLFVTMVLIFGVTFVIGRAVKRTVTEAGKNPAKSAAELAVRLNPDVDLVSSDDTSITVKDKKTGKVTTFDFDEVNRGNIHITNEEGSADLSVTGDGTDGGITYKSDEGEVHFGSGTGAAELPAWVPVLPDARDRTAAFTSKMGDKVAGSFTFETDQGPDEVIAYYKGELEAGGFEVHTSTLSLGDADGPRGTVSGVDSAGHRQVAVIVASQQGELHVSVTYSAGS